MFLWLGERKVKMETKKVPEYIAEFMQAVYPEAPELAMACFDEQTVLRAATVRIRTLERVLRTHLPPLGHYHGPMGECPACEVEKLPFIKRKK